MGEKNAANLTGDYAKSVPEAIVPRDEYGGVLLLSLPTVYPFEFWDFP